MDGLIVSTRRGKHKQSMNQFLLDVEGVSDKTVAAKFIGKKVSWLTKSGEIHGQVSAVHGNTGTLRVRFPKNMSGNIIGKTVSIQE